MMDNSLSKCFSSSTDPSSSSPMLILFRSVSAVTSLSLTVVVFSISAVEPPSGPPPEGLDRAGEVRWAASFDG